MHLYIDLLMSLNWESVGDSDNDNRAHHALFTIQRGSSLGCQAVNPHSCRTERATVAMKYMLEVIIQWTLKMYKSEFRIYLI